MSEINGDWKLPKNVRQVGEADGSSVIYVEDYVITFLGDIPQAVLFGSVRQRDGKHFIFVEGALETNGFTPSSEEKKQLLEKVETYFKEKRVVGWFLSVEESPFVMNKELAETFKNEFAGEDQILMIRDLTQEETNVYLPEGNLLTRQDGYFIYYEKNVPMQEYMIARNSGDSLEKEQPVKDEAIKRFRKIVKRKNEKKTQEEKRQWQLPSVGRLSYLAGGVLTVTVLALGVTVVNNYDRMKAVEQSLAMLTNNIDSQEQYLASDGSAQVMLHIEEELGQETTDSAEETWTRQGEASQSGAQNDSVQDDGAQNAESGQSTGGEEAQQTARQSAGSDGQTANGESAAANSRTIGGEGTAANNQTVIDESTGQAAGTQPQTEAQETVATMATTAGRASYTVKAGDTLAGISEMYYGNLEKLEEICSLNGIDDENTILPGQKILLP